jgi:hypothetical protein
VGSEGSLTDDLQLLNNNTDFSFDILPPISFSSTMSFSVEPSDPTEALLSIHQSVTTILAKVDQGVERGTLEGSHLPLVAAFSQEWTKDEMSLKKVDRQEYRSR